MCTNRDLSIKTRRLHLSRPCVHQLQVVPLQALVCPANQVPWFLLAAAPAVAVAVAVAPEVGLERAGLPGLLKIAAEMQDQPVCLCVYL
jgi:hypothetical protein